ncbi:hypothetical protein GCM10011403_20830 [Pseudohongiella nitratireducens]|uniref:YrhK domain-containing protein n=1 Tax=Pseudohongiella nitratireducens TaxID=1768907 RepID=A0A916QKW5_9GAMM|nr:YrhK family protein [Pseudohongiella nitratireducens]MDF1622471.1 YrhK family protein [Pseudohongiella nitratireducens]GFZ77545.1 hypothetical protein GCM10011403_20830 [Pseudohongiella nitratireducens]|tara:strand:+ start:220 stop:393 length:174 start_codon:yes stop_codon:yes gene_type:complete
MKVSRFERLRKNGLGVVSSLAFFFGSMLFLPHFADYATAGVWLFMAGSVLMFVDTVW